MNDELKEHTNMLLLLLGKDASTKEILEELEKDINIEYKVMDIICYLADLRIRK